MRAVLRIVPAFTLALNAVAFQDQQIRPLPRPTIDVIAADGLGRRVDSLDPGDFAAFEDGLPRPIASAEFVRDRSRVFGIFLDEFHTAPGAAADRTREALLSFVRTGLGADDRIAVFKPLDSLLAIKLTDRESAARVIESFEGRQGDYTPRSAFEQNFLAWAPARIDRARNQIAVSALNAMAIHLGAATSGRKTLVVVSGGLQRRSRVRGDEPLPTLESVVRAANRNHVSIYPIAPRSTADAGAAGDVLRALAAETAGRALLATDDLAAGLNAVMSDASGYYLVTLQPGDRRPGDRFHPVEMQTTRKGVTLRARRGYWVAAPAPVRSTRLGREPAPVANKISPLIRPWFGMAPGSDGATRVSFVWEPAPRVPGDRLRQQVPARIALTVSRADTGATVFDGAVLPSSQATDVADGEETRAMFELPPGKMRVRMSIQDSASQQLDTDVREVVVGSFPGPLTLGTLQVLRTRSAREFRSVAASVDAAPVAARQFSRAERLLIRVPVYAAGDPPTVSASLVNRFGVMRALKAERSPGSGGYQIDVPLASLVAGDYVVEVTASTEDGAVRDSVTFRVTP
ncbi:MAG: VWA domain-containing protein [Luteitalea sp.]|nr:VWA domain-containing protein [Luteitalea sp.]